MQRAEGPCPRPQRQQLLESGVFGPPLLCLLRPGPSVCTGGGDGGGGDPEQNLSEAPPTNLRGTGREGWPFEDLSTRQVSGSDLPSPGARKAIQ